MDAGKEPREDCSVANKRSFHDLWMLLLYLIITTIAISTTLWRFEGVYLLRKNEEFLVLGAVFTAAMFILFFVLGLLIWIPRTFLHLVFAAGFCIQLYFVAQEKELSFILLYSVAPLVTLNIYLLKVRMYINLMPRIIERAIDIVLEHLGASSVSVVFFSLLPITQFLLLFVYHAREKSSNCGHSVSLGMCLAWTVFNSGHYIEMFHASQTVLSLDGKKMSKFILALKSFTNTLCSSGSVCLAGSLYLIVFVIGIFTRNDSRASESAHNENFFKLLAITVITFVSVVSRTFLTFGNSMTFPNIALYGNGYTTSMKNSHERISHFKGRMLTNTWCLKIVFLFVVLLFVGAAHELIRLSELRFGREYSRADYRRMMAVYVAPSAFFLFLSLEAVSSAINTLKYIYIEAPEMMRRADPELASDLRTISYSK